MSYIFVVDNDKLSEEKWNKFISGEDCLILHKKNISEAHKMNLEEYCLDYADMLYKENIRRLNRLSESEREEVFCDDPGIMYRSSPNILYIYKPSEVKKRLDDYEKRIKVGDVVLFSYYGDIVKALVTKCEKVNLYQEKGACSDVVYVIQKDGQVYVCLSEECEKTGEHYDSIDEFMKE